MSSPQAFFVYGTLKKAQLRSEMWPRPPLSIEPAVVSGILFDLGPYPAMSTGEGWVLGELWKFRTEDIGITKRVLDQIEGYQEGNSSNEYVRKIVEIESPTRDKLWESTQAFAYFAPDPDRLQLARRIPATQQYHGRIVASWPDSESRVPRNFDEE